MKTLLSAIFLYIGEIATGLETDPAILRAMPSEMSSFSKIISEVDQLEMNRS